MSKHSVAKDTPVVADGMTLGVIGAGVMGQTLIRGLISGGVISKDRVWAGDKNSSACSKAAEALDVPAETDFQHRVPKSDLILICVKPADAPIVLATLRNAGLRRDTLLISILAGISTDRIESLLGTDNPVVRAMPNTPAVVGEGMTVVCAGIERVKDSSGSRGTDLRRRGQVSFGRRGPLQRGHCTERQRTRLPVLDHGGAG